ncbi:MAG: nuclear transport factor 2 family protein [Alphaproteobacteria bacterium]|nr:nuclear transport factor 2 family protein [Alphaproteobacteria bacterium]
MAAIPAAIANYVEGLKRHQLASIAATVAEDLRFVTTRKVMNKPEFLAFLTALYTGFPDWHYDHDPIETRPDGTIAIKWRQGGTHTATLALPGFPAVAATGRRVLIPPHYFFYKLAREKIVEIRPDPIPGGAPRGIFEQIGVALPPL